MIKLYTNRELSEKLGINLAKWKRWSREFLPPDSLGGMQSGFARQYYFKDALNVMLGGHLVGDLHFSVYEARRIIEDLKDWLNEKGFYQSPEENLNDLASESQILKYRIFIHQQFEPDKGPPIFIYKIRNVIFNQSVVHHGDEAREERYMEYVINSDGKEMVAKEMGYEKILDMTSLYTYFIGRLLK